MSFFSNQHCYLSPTQQLEVEISQLESIIAQANKQAAELEQQYKEKIKKYIAFRFLYASLKQSCNYEQALSIAKKECTEHVLLDSLEQLFDPYKEKNENELQKACDEVYEDYCTPPVEAALEREWLTCLCQIEIWKKQLAQYEDQLIQLQLQAASVQL